MPLSSDSLSSRCKYYDPRTLPLSSVWDIKYRVEEGGASGGGRGFGCWAAWAARLWSFGVTVGLR
jgi:hypothetical protein